MDFSRCSGSQALPMGQDLLFPQAQPVCSGLTSKEDEGNESILHESTPIKQWAGSSVTLSPSGMDFAEDLLSDVCQFNFDFQTASAEDTANMFPAAYGQDPFRTATPGSASDSTGDGPSSLLDSTEVYDSVAMEPSFSNDSYLDIHNVQYGGMEPKDPHMYDSPAPAKTPFRSANSQELGGLCLAAKQNWPGPDGACFSPEEFKSHPAFYSACQTTWSSPTTSSAEPSLGSSYSQGFQQPYLSSPTSLSAHESITSMEDPISSPFSLGPAQQFHGSDALQSCDALSTLRPQHGFQRQSLPCWTPPENIPGPMLAHSGSFLYRRPSSDGENTARRNELYQRSPEDDGLYHCPFAVSEGCMHKPEKLKCNYDKHLDAHLKPYRCKDPACLDVPFSSTACLLRHEREAHGMHGHGDKPYLCTYGDCDRSIVGNGFPRRWNLQDHMKRVHDYTGPTIPSDKPSSSESVSGRTARKTKKVASSLSATSKRNKAGIVTKSSSKAPVPVKQRLSIQKGLVEQLSLVQSPMNYQDEHGIPTSDHSRLGMMINNTELIY